MAENLTGDTGQIFKEIGITLAWHTNNLFDNRRIALTALSTAPHNTVGEPQFIATALKAHVATTRFYEVLNEAGRFLGPGKLGSIAMAEASVVDIQIS